VVYSVGDRVRLAPDDVRRREEGWGVPWTGGIGEVVDPDLCTQHPFGSEGMTCVAWEGPFPPRWEMNYSLAKEATNG
jgi:hypothetical protein